MSSPCEPKAIELRRCVALCDIEPVTPGAGGGGVGCWDLLLGSIFVACRVLGLLQGGLIRLARLSIGRKNIQRILVVYRKKGNMSSL
jgi:hypothetical protein